MEEKIKEITCDVCKELYPSDHIVPYIIFAGEALLVPEFVRYQTPVSFNMCIKCSDEVSIDKIFEKLQKK